MSDCQLVPSQAVSWPSRPLAVTLATPMFAPSSVTRTDSLPGRLLLWPAWLTLPASVEMLAVADPACSPTDTATRRLPPAAACGVMPRIDVSDSHAVAPHAVSPTDTHAVPPASPACTPCTVTHDEPEPGMLAWRSELRSGIDPDRRPVAELTLKAVVTSTRLLPTAPPWCARQTIDESETHVVD